jgi:alpha-1,2-mannosyltransferase
MIPPRSASSAASLRRALVGAAPLLALLALALTLGAVLASAGSTLGYDFEAYRRAGERLLAGQPLYDTTAAVAGPFALFLYPPPFALALVPFALPPVEIARMAWIAGLIGAFLGGTAILPVRSNVKLAIIALAAASLPFLYAVKLGQVGPLLYLAFAVAWRAMDAPLATGIALAAGTLTKLQPGLLFGWLLFRRRGTALVVGLAAIALAVLAATLVVGIGAWHDYIELLRRVGGDPITTPKNMTFGAVAFRYGLDAGLAGTVQTVAVVVTIAGVVFAWLRRDPATGLLVGVMASQLASPVIWDHYAMLVLLPVALLLQRRQWWAAALPILPWLGVDVLYPATMVAACVGLLFSGSREGDIRVIHAWPGTAGW